MISRKMAEVFTADTSSLSTLSTGYTYSGHPVGCAAALASIAEAQRLNVAANAKVMGEKLMDGLLELQQRHEIIGDVRGIGLMCSLDLVASRMDKQPLDKSRMAAIQDAIYRAGALVRVSGNYIILSPPLIVSEAHVEEILDSLRQGFAQA